MKLYQISMSDGIAFIVPEKGVDKFHKEKTYKIEKGCIVIAKDGRQIVLHDLSKNDHVGSPIILSNHIIRVQRVKKGSDLETLYLKVTSNSDFGPEMN